MGKTLLLTNLADNYLSGNSKEFMIDEINKLMTHCDPSGETIKEVLFIPYANEYGLDILYSTYITQVDSIFGMRKIRVITEFSNPLEAISAAKAICVGGGNLSFLKNTMTKIMYEKIKEKISNGMPYIGWNEGAILACPTHIDDLVCVEELINAVPFQLYCHFKKNVATEAKIEAFLLANADRVLPIVQVVCFSDELPSDDSIISFSGKNLKDSRDNTPNRDDEDTGGSGVVVEDDEAGLAGTESTSTITIYQLVDEKLFAIEINSNNLPIM